MSVKAYRIEIDNTAAPADVREKIVECLERANLQGAVMNISSPRGQTGMINIECDDDAFHVIKRAGIDGVRTIVPDPSMESAHHRHPVPVP